MVFSLESVQRAHNRLRVRQRQYIPLSLYISVCLFLHNILLLHYFYSDEVSSGPFGSQVDCPITAFSEVFEDFELVDGPFPPGPQLVLLYLYVFIAQEFEL